MGIIMGSILTLLFGLTLALLVRWFYLCRQLFHFLKKYHRMAFVRLGKPSFSFNRNVKSDLLLFRFIRDNEWQKLNDSELSILCIELRRIGRLYLILLLLAVILIALSNLEIL